MKEPVTKNELYRLKIAIQQKQDALDLRERRLEAREEWVKKSLKTIEKEGGRKDRKFCWDSFFAGCLVTLVVVLLTIFVNV